MQVLEFTLKILMVVGCWPPNSWTSSLCKRTVYNAYTIFISLLLFTFVLSQLMDIILNVDNTDDFADTFYVMLALVISCCKMIGLLINRKNIEMLTNILIRKPFIPLEADEIEIRHRFDKTIQTNSLCYTILVETTCICIALTSVFTNFRKGTLTYREWTPYNSSVIFRIMYTRQLISTLFGSMVNVACDTLICGLLLHVCCQLEILECRLRKFTLGRNNLRECLRQHDGIFKFAFMVNEKFKIIIGIQFIVSTLVVCSNLYQLAKMTMTSVQAFPLILYTCSMLAQILIYCWYGNEVKLKSVELVSNVFKTEWLELDQSGKKSLLIIMNRSLIPIEFSSAYILTLNLDSFVNLLKTSYSAYNILQQMGTT
ncbi:Odorant receptor 020 [Nylanderia fulva]|nr:Odorant receptor 020 [Nylanderia fulva]